MSEVTKGTEFDIGLLRERFYNATVERRIDIHDDLVILRIRPDQKYPAFPAGQYTLLGLGEWELRADGVARSMDTMGEGLPHQQLIRRAYSISCPVLDAQGRLVCCEELPFLEFYVALVSRRSDHPPMLSPRLFALKEGSRIFLGHRAHGHYTTTTLKPADDVAFFATGTGEAPHNAMIAQLLAREHTGRIASVACVRHRRDLGYAAPLRELEKRYPNYRYITLTTREPENLDPTCPGYVGKQYLQDFVASGRLEQELGYDLQPRTAHVFLCGSPAMIGVPHKGADGHLVYPEPPGLAEVFGRRGFEIDHPHKPGTLHFEKYW